MVLSRLGNLTLQLPDTESLQQAGIQEFSEDVASKRPPTMLNPKLISKMQALETQQSNHSNTASNMVTLGRGLQLLPKKMVDQIRSNQYVDFTEPPPAKGFAKTIPQTFVGDGQLILVQTTDLTDSRRIIPSLAVWLQCFSLYIAALSPPQDRLCDLMAYQAFIARCSVKYNWPSLGGVRSELLHGSCEPARPPMGSVRLRYLHPSLHKPVGLCRKLVFRVPKSPRHHA